MKKEFDIIEWFEELANKGYAPALINDDNGHWAVSFDGYQSAPMGDQPQDIQTTFLVEAHYWKDSIREAIKYAKKEIEEEERED